MGDTEFDSEFASGEQLGDTPIGLSDSPRLVEPVPDMAWKLRKATEWRSHLPRIAQTLAKAWALDGGARPMEIEDLHKVLYVQREIVLDSYQAGATDMPAVGNWMLMSAIDAVHGRQPLLAAYHFRWFDATQQAAES